MKRKNKIGNNAEMKSERGAATIFFMIILSVIFLFVTMFADFARIKAGQYQAELAIKSSLRSLYSHFDSTIQPYGLYGVNHQNPDALVKQIIEENLRVSDGDHSWLDTDVTAIQLNHGYNLAHVDVFEQQIMEDMKYTAPIEIISSIVNTFSKNNLKEEMEKSVKLADELEEIEELMNDRDKKANALWKETKDFIGNKGSVSHLYTVVDVDFEALDSLADEIGDEDETELRNKLKSLKDEKKELKKRMKEEQTAEEDENEEDDSAEQSNSSKLEEELKEIEEEIEEVNDILDKIDQFFEIYDEVSDKIELYRASFKESNEDISKYLEQTEDYNHKLKQKLQEADLDRTTYGPLIDSIHIYDDDFFSKYRSNMADILSKFNAFEQSFQSISVDKPADFNPHYSKLTTKNHAYYNKANSVFTYVSNNRKNIESKQDEMEKEKDNQLDEIEKQLTKLDTITGICPSSLQPLYDQLEGENGFYNMYKQYNESEDNESSMLIEDIQDSEKIGKQSMNFLDQITNALNDVAAGVYVNEYALTKFNYRTMQEPGTKSTQTATALSQPLQHTLPTQEAEYILYGFDTCKKNLSSAYAEMYLIRLAIHTAENLTEPDSRILSLGSPLLAFLAAVAEAALEAYNDMNKLIEGKDVSISKKFTKSLTFNYKDYLRLFMLIHHNQQNMMYRMQSLIQLNTGVNLQDRPVYTEAQVTMQTKLLFMPTTMKMINRNVEERYDLEPFQFVYSY
ncbi:hypothetical protein [Longirhabdus pacifica]|uniref:hypothetical protein n=1 Tax=Longirhabdus pacifica TaxID=2305227 RepID=UPI0010090760|nr:hypothetical protein [Longirhabdus pacifica]